jgi:hypothetical protein
MSIGWGRWEGLGNDIVGAAEAVDARVHGVIGAGGQGER